MEFYETINQRRTVREFLDKDVDFEVIKRILEAGNKAPTWNHNRNWSYIVLRTDEEKEFAFEYAKYSQNDDLKEKLLKTGNRLPAECAVQNKIWATGISMKDDSRFDMNKWTGQNLLGFATMLVREKIKVGK